MRVTLVRHGEAGDDAPDDESRSLTVRGRADTRRVGRALAGRGVRFSLIVSSPLVRAVQTAEIVAAELGYRGRLLVSPLLVPEAPAARTAEFVSGLAGERSVALVAHEPILSKLAAALLDVPRYPALRKSEALRLRLSAAGGEPAVARWRIDPDTGRRQRL
jgi:phosphohistidine phosphatase